MKSFSILITFALIFFVGVQSSVAYEVKGKPGKPTDSTGKEGFCKGQKGDRLVFHLTVNGVVDRTVPKHEGPSCVAVLYDPVRFSAVLSSTSSLTPGPDLGTAITMGKTTSSFTPDAASFQNTITYVRNFLNYADTQVLTAKSPTSYAKLLEDKAKDKIDETETLQANLASTHLKAMQVASSTNEEIKALALITELWYQRFSNVGLIPNVTVNNSDMEVLQASVVAEQECACGNIFNNTSATTFNLSVTDYAPTLDAKGTLKSSQQGGFAVVTCGTPFSASAGVEFSTIPNQQFGIVQAPGGPNNTSIKQYGYTTDSPVHTLPLAVANVRFWESYNKLYSAHYSLGVSGNIQSVGSGGSSVEFLPGISVAFFRTMFVTLGPHIGYNSTLAGGVKVGDTVATDVTSPTVVKSATVRFGVAISFTKP